MGLTLEDYVNQMGGRSFYYDSATDGFSSVLRDLQRRHPSLAGKPNVLVPRSAPEKLRNAALNEGYEVRYYNIIGGRRADPSHIRSLSDDKTVALLMVHHFGIPGNVDDLRFLATQAGIMLLEDCALTINSTHHNLQVGTLGDCSFFSFRKSLMTPRGGALVINNPNWDFRPSLHPPANTRFPRLRLLPDGTSLQRLRPSGPRIHPVAKARPFLSSTLSQAQLAYFKLIDVAGIARARRDNYLFLQEGLAQISYAHPLFPELPAGSTPFSFPVLVSEEIRNTLHDWLLRRGIVCGNGNDQPPVYPHTTDTDGIRRKVLELPIHQLMMPAQLSRILRYLREFRETIAYFAA